MSIVVAVDRTWNIVKGWEEGHEGEGGMG